MEKLKELYEKKTNMSKKIDVNIYDCELLLEKYKGEKWKLQSECIALNKVIEIYKKMNDN